MGEVISMSRWRDGLEGRSSDARRPIRGGAVWHPSRGTGGPGVGADGVGDTESLRRLEGAVDRIDRVTSRVARRGGRLSPDVETELLALLGQITLGLVPEAATRAERLADVLGSAASSGP
jgi:hypothetical protein